MFKFYQALTEELRSALNNKLIFNDLITSFLYPPASTSLMLEITQDPVSREKIQNEIKAHGYDGLHAGILCKNPQHDTFLLYLYKHSEFELLQALLDFELSTKDMPIEHDEQFSTFTLPVETKNEPPEEKIIRPFGLFSLNVQDEKGNTLLHYLVKNTFEGKKQSETPALFAKKQTLLLTNIFTYFQFEVNPYIKNKQKK